MGQKNFFQKNCTNCCTYVMNPLYLPIEKTELNQNFNRFCVIAPYLFYIVMSNNCLFALEEMFAFQFRLTSVTVPLHFLGLDCVVTASSHRQCQEVPYYTTVKTHPFFLSGGSRAGIGLYSCAPNSVCCQPMTVCGIYECFVCSLNTDSGAFSPVGTEGKRSFCDPTQHGCHFMIELGMKT